MGWLDLLRRRVAKEQPGPSPDAGTSEALTGLRIDINQLFGRVGTIDIAIKRHDDQLMTHEARLREHGDKLQTLEQKVTISLAQPMAFRQAGRHGPESMPRLSAHPAYASPARQFDIEQFTEQQKRVLAVFFQNKGRRMSYADVARVLNKSAYTIKNQVNQIRQKADLFDCTIGNQSRNLFALKADLRVEKYLKVGQPNERPMSMPERDQSEVESEAKKAEPVIEYAQERSEPEDEI
jgi:DNA-binding CsgD family transcriptional regulator